MAAAAQPDLHVDLMEEILLRVDDVADLIRASAACTSFHRIISNGRFLRRFRSFHRPPILGILAGFYGRDGEISFYPARPPHSSAPAARALTRAADFSVNSLSDPTPYWCIRDVRDGRVLLSRRDARAIKSLFDLEYLMLMVYDPLHRRQVQIPPIPHDLLAAVGHDDNWWRWQEFDPFLVPVAPSGTDDLSFQVMCNVLSEHKVETFIYSSVTEEWRGMASSSITSCKFMKFPCLVDRSYARGCFYWVDYIASVMLMLDMCEMKFSIIDLPAGSKLRNKTIVEVKEDRIGLLIIVGENTLHLYSKTLSDIGIGAKDWRHDHTIRLSNDYKWSLTGGAVEGYALLNGISRYEYEMWESCEDKEPTSEHCFTLELETLQVEELCVLKFNADPHFLYASLPPPFATPSI
ncbi:unnamed protein product [Urochloa decumbens]|uniref:F-box protein AT5G49610-like beta-propeller domain-containing protein n=1 Tax=Urochloa decumbens TaxID=240449 RepID=A0ABC8VHK4_9POAL